MGGKRLKVRFPFHGELLFLDHSIVGRHQITVEARKDIKIRGCELYFR